MCQSERGGMRYRAAQVPGQTKMLTESADRDRKSRQIGEGHDGCESEVRLGGACFCREKERQKGAKSDCHDIYHPTISKFQFSGRDDGILRM